MVYCSAIGCQNRSNDPRGKVKKRCADEVKGWHVVPYKLEETTLRKKWLQAMKREPPYPQNPQNFIVCGVHFEDSSFKRDLKYEMCGGKRKFSLVENAVPSIFTFSVDSKKRVTSKQRIDKRDRTIEVDEICSPSTSATVVNARTMNIDNDSDPETIQSIPSSQSSEDEDYTIEETEEEDEIFEVPDGLVKYCLVDWDLLQPLFRHCPTCGHISKITRVVSKGSMIKVEINCGLHTTNWSSQKTKQKIAEGNLLLSAGILLAGLTFEPVKRLMSIVGIQFIGRSNFYKLQKRFLFPAINHVYTGQQKGILSSMQGKSLDIIGDGRFDSPGNSAKFGTYTIMDSETDKVLSFFIAHVSNAGNSQRMEVYAFRKVLAMILDVGIIISTLTTDRHKSIKKIMRENYSNILHQFDVWHFSKNIKSDLRKAVKSKKHAPLKPWVKSIINHFWWACSSCERNVDILKEKWVSVLNHVIDIHKWDGCTLFHECLHAPITTEMRATKKWLVKGSPSYEKLKSIVMNEKRFKDLKYLIQFRHSGELEVLHALFNAYCSKRFAFSYEGMYARTQMAIMDHNSGVGRSQAVTKAGKARFKTVYSKVSASWVAKKIMEDKDKSYITEILIAIWEVTEKKLSGPELEAVPKNIAPVPNPGKEAVIQAHTTRFT